MKGYEPTYNQVVDGHSIGVMAILPQFILTSLQLLILISLLLTELVCKIQYLKNIFFRPQQQRGKCIELWKNWGEKLKSKCWTASYTICIDKVSAVGYFKAPLGNVCNAMPNWPWEFSLWSQGKDTGGMITVQRSGSLRDLSLADGIDDKSFLCI